MKYRALLDQMKAIRGYLLASVEGLDDEQLLRVPQGFTNNILWNVGHTITDNCTMLYPPTGQPLPLPEQYLQWFKPGKSPADWTDTPPIAEVLESGITTRDKLFEDCIAGKMEDYEPLALGDGTVLNNIAYAIAHCNIHEGIHLGVILALRKFV